MWAVSRFQNKRTLFRCLYCDGPSLLEWTQLCCNLEEALSCSCICISSWLRSDWRWLTELAMTSLCDVKGECEGHKSPRGPKGYFWKRCKGYFKTSPALKHCRNTIMSSLSALSLSTRARRGRAAARCWCWCSWWRWCWCWGVSGGDDLSDFSKGNLPFHASPGIIHRSLHSALIIKFNDASPGHRR